MTRPASREGVRRALDQDELLLFYQPIHEIESRRIVAAEALLRSHRPDGEIRNAEPIAAGAETGPDLFRLDSWLMHQAFEDATHWQGHGGEGIRLNINLSPNEFEVGDKIRTLANDIFKNCGLDPKLVNIEITETAYIKKPADTMHVLTHLHSLGPGIWLDDFGTGYSSISHLLHFPLDGLKLPKEFVCGLPNDPRSRAIATHIIAMAHDLGMRVIAEGIEHDEQLTALREMRCDWIQGFLFSKPMPLDKFEEMLRA